MKGTFFLWIALACCFFCDRGCASASGGSDNIQEAYDDFCKTHSPAQIVFGCGRKHAKLTYGGNPHNHEDAFTIDSKAFPGSTIPNSYQVANPHCRGNVQIDYTWKSLSSGSASSIVWEHLNIDFNPSLSPGLLLNTLRHVYRVLKKGGTFTYLSGIVYTKGLLECTPLVMKKSLETLGFEVREHCWMVKTLILKEDSSYYREGDWHEVPSDQEPDIFYYAKVVAMKKEVRMAKRGMRSATFCVKENSPPIIITPTLDKHGKKTYIVTQECEQQQDSKRQRISRSVTR